MKNGILFFYSAFFKQTCTVPFWNCFITILINQDFPGGSVVKNPPAIQETPSSIPELGSSLKEGIGYTLHDSWASLMAQQVKKSESEVAQSCLTLCDPTDCSLRGFSIHGIFQARVPEWVAISFSRGSFQPRDRTWVSYIASGFLTI